MIRIQMKFAFRKTEKISEKSVSVLAKTSVNRIFGFGLG